MELLHELLCLQPTQLSFSVGDDFISKGLKMGARSLCRSQARKVMPKPETLQEP